MFQRFSNSARAAVLAAQEQARDGNRPVIDVEQLLLGIIATADAPLATMLDDLGLSRDAVQEALDEAGRAQPLGAADAVALRSIGIDLDAVRRSLEETFGPDALDRTPPAEESRGFLARLRGNHIPFTAGAKKVLELGLREAIARKDDRIETEHLLLGVLRAPNDTTRGLIEPRIGVAELRGKVLDLLDRAV